jgi:hypothetical protein
MKIISKEYNENTLSQENYIAISKEVKKDLRNIHNNAIDAHDKTSQEVKEAINAIVSPIVKKMEAHHAEIKENLLDKVTFIEISRKTEEYLVGNQAQLRSINVAIEEEMQNSQTYYNNLEETTNNLARIFTEKLLELMTKTAKIYSKQEELVIQNERFSVVQDEIVKSKAELINEIDNNSRTSIEKSEANITALLNIEGNMKELNLSSQ